MYLRRVYYSGEFSSTLDTLEYYVRKLIPQTHFGRIITLFLLIHSEYLQFLSPYNTKYYKMDLNHRIKFLSIIITTTPRTDMGKWDQIAMEMNQYLHERNTRSRGTRDSFFDGKQCLDFFQKEFEPLVSDKTPTTFFKRILQPLFPGQLLPYYDLECIAADALGVYQSNSESASILSKLFNISSSLLTVTLMLRNIYINYRRLSMTWKGKVRTVSRQRSVDNAHFVSRDLHRSLSKIFCSRVNDDRLKITELKSRISSPIATWTTAHHCNQTWNWIKKHKKLFCQRTYLEADLLYMAPLRELQMLYSLDSLGVVFWLVMHWLRNKLH